jgi:hypothetical protein
LAKVLLASVAARSPKARLSYLVEVAEVCSFVSALVSDTSSFFTTARDSRNAARRWVRARLCAPGLRLAVSFCLLCQRRQRLLQRLHDRPLRAAGRDMYQSFPWNEPDSATVVCDPKQDLHVDGQYAD